MRAVHRLEPGAAAVPLAHAMEAFLAQVPNPNSARSYRVALRALVAELGPDTPLVVLDQERTAERVGCWFTECWGSASNATVNARLDALRSAAAWWRTQDWITGEPSRRIRRRPRTPDRTRSLGRAEIETLLSRPTLPLRERTLWRMLYETAARTHEILSLDIEELDLRNRRANVRRKGGAADVIIWRTTTARLLPRLLERRRAGPVFLTDRAARRPLPPSGPQPGHRPGPAVLPPRSRVFPDRHREPPRGALDPAPATALRADPRRRRRRQHLHPARLLRAHLHRLPGPLHPPLPRSPGPLATGPRPRHPPPLTTAPLECAGLASGLHASPTHPQSPKPSLYLRRRSRSLFFLWKLRGGLCGCRWRTTHTTPLSRPSALRFPGRRRNVLRPTPAGRTDAHRTSIRA
ncbi:MAG TPA: tyrosine-type recombinase/integrase, partial [Pseudonocardiaceae bacterium]|nr:tyrosine-type recombinase/integrase [Pseudonocardiaceae bacterium]